MFGSLYCLVNCDFKAWASFGLVSTSLYACRLQHLIFHFFFLDRVLHCLWFRFAVDCTPYVRLRCVIIIVQKQGT